MSYVESIAHRKDKTMARAATKKPSKLAKPKKAPAGKTAAKPVKTPARKSAAKKAPAAKTPPISKDALRAQLEKLTNANATLKTKNREANKALKAADARIAELEHEVSQSHSKPVIDHETAPKPNSPRKPRTPKSAAAPKPMEEPQEHAETPAEEETI
jgi:hypothetical protein